MKQKYGFLKFLRVITIPPVMALLTLSVLFLSERVLFREDFHFLLSILFLTVLPVSAYPLQHVSKKLKEEGREGQRHLAMIMSMIGYVSGIVCSLLLHFSGKLLLIYTTYLLSGTAILIFNKVLSLRASGHACGVAGPISYLCYILGPMALSGIVFLIIVYWSSLSMRRHTVPQLLMGTVIPIAALFISMAII